VAQHHARELGECMGLMQEVLRVDVMVAHQPEQGAP
jgi:hypothetical protein